MKRFYLIIVCTFILFSNAWDVTGKPFTGLLNQENSSDTSYSSENDRQAAIDNALNYFEQKKNVSMGKKSSMIDHASQENTDGVIKEPENEDSRPIEFKEKSLESGGVKRAKSLGTFISSGSDKKGKTILIDSLELKNTDIIDVLKLIADKSGLDILVGRDVAGKVSIYLKDVAVLDALKIILESYNFAYAEEDGIVRIMTDRDFQLKYGYKFGEKIETRILQLFYTDASEIAIVLNQMKSVGGKIIAEKTSNSIIIIDNPDKINMLEKFVKGVDVPRITEVFELNYAPAEDVSKKLKEALTKNIGKIEIDIRSNKIIVTDISQRMPQIEKIIKAVDVKVKEVLIEARIVQVILSDQYQMGVNWEAVVSKYHSLDLSSNFNILDTASTIKQGKLTVGTIANDNYTAMIQALQTVGTTNLLSSPRITVINNKEAKILVGSNEPYTTSTTVTPASGPNITSESVNFIEVGVKLYVTPNVHNDGYITMEIKPEVSSVTRTITTSNNNTIPVVETSQAETTVAVKDGVTIVIGGLMKDEKIKSVKKIPFLGDLPVLGAVFRSTNNSVRKTELVIFLTPRIISGDYDMR